MVSASFWNFSHPPNAPAHPIFAPVWKYQNPWTYINQGGIGGAWFSASVEGEALGVAGCSSSLFALPTTTHAAPSTEYRAPQPNSALPRCRCSRRLCRRVCGPEPSSPLSVRGNRISTCRVTPLFSPRSYYFCWNLLLNHNDCLRGQLLPSQNSLHLAKITQIQKAVCHPQS